MADSKDDRYARYTDPVTGRPDLGLFAEAVVGDAKAYFETQKELTTLAVSEKAGRAVAMVVVGLVLFFTFGAAFLLASVALALWLGKLLGTSTMGFGAVAVLYVLLGMVFFLLWRSFLKDTITLAVIRAIHGND